MEGKVGREEGNKKSGREKSNKEQMEGKRKEEVIGFSSDGVIPKAEPSETLQIYAKGHVR